MIINAITSQGEEVSINPSISYMETVRENHTKLTEFVSFYTISEAVDLIQKEITDIKITAENVNEAVFGKADFKRGLLTSYDQTLNGANTTPKKYARVRMKKVKDGVYETEEGKTYIKGLLLNPSKREVNPKAPADVKLLTKIKNCIKENLNLKTWVSVECKSYTEGNTN